jgi:hypothetical protein
LPDEAPPERLLSFQGGSFTQPIRVGRLVPEERRQYQPIEGIAELRLPESGALSNDDDGCPSGEDECVEPLKSLSCPGLKGV